MAETVTKSIVDARRQDRSSSVKADAAEASPATVVDKLLYRYESPPGSPIPVAGRQRRIALLTRTIKSQVLPTLALTHRCNHNDSRPASVIDDAALTEFTALVLANDLQAGTACIEDRVARGASLQDICISLLTPAAQRLGEMWDSDHCSFVDVTAGLGTLHTIMCGLQEICGPAPPARDPTRRILLASIGESQHTFGLQMVAEVFRHAGWDVTVETAAREADLPAFVTADWFAIAGLSVARDRQTRSLGLTIRAIRQASCNSSIGIMIGGPVVGRQPNLARLVGADVAALDASQAVLRAEGLRLLMASMEPPNNQP